MTVTVEKRITFNEEEWAEHLIDNLYDMLENGGQDEDWQCLTEEQQETVVKEILIAAVRQTEED